MSRTPAPRVLFLGHEDSPILARLRSLAENVHGMSSRVDGDFVQRVGASIVVSHGYRHILRPATLAVLPHRFVNLHISLLPWNRGADPNLWSFLEDTPKGVTIHEIDEGIDTGSIIAQRVVRVDIRGTLATTYRELQEAMLELFTETWPAIRAGAVEGRPQQPGGSLHTLKDKEPYLHLLRHGWDTHVSELIGKAL